VTFRTKLLVLTSITVAGAVALVTGATLCAARQAFEKNDGSRRDQLLQQLQQEFAQRGVDLGRQMVRVAASPVTERIGLEAGEYDLAQQEAVAENLDFLDVLRPDLTILSSAHWAAKFGYKNDWQIAPEDWHSTGAFLARIPIPEGGTVPAQIVVRTTPDKRALVVGGRRIDSAFVKSLGQAPGMRAVLWLPPGEVIDAQGSALDVTKLAGLVQKARSADAKVVGTVQWGSTQSSAEAFVGAPLEQRGQIAGVLLAGNSLAGQLTLEREILGIGVAVGCSGIIIGVLLGWWTTERITRPVSQLVMGARAIAGGDWSPRIEVMSNDEIGELAGAFNRMTEQLSEQRERAIQAERVAAWRELARRLAHELKNPLFPLQITVENLQRARKLTEAEFNEVFQEGTSTLLAELGTLKTIIGRFSDFAKMPPPQFETVDLNETARGLMKLHEAQFQANSRGAIRPILTITEPDLRIAGDPEQLRRALGNLVLNAIDAMPEGGTLEVITSRRDGFAQLSISDTGKGLTEEECARLFTPYYTTKQHGTGLGLAIVQSVVSDHHGKISVASGPGQGARFVIELPITQEEMH
jgi:two-component system, NtrC family, nitrogen regulation sensor histidine kinase NtrY